jgi:outer membrane protein, heavy metal efflux system
VSRLAVQRIGPALLLAAAVVSGCAAYRPEPLEPAAARALAGPDLAAGRPGAAPVDLDAPLTPQALAAIAVIASPELKAARGQAGLADAQVFAAGLMPDPLFNLSYDWRLSGPDPFNGMAAQVIYDLMAFRDRAATLAVARAAREQVRDDLAWREWQTAGQARLLAGRIVALAAAAPLLEESRAAAQQALAAALAAAERGDLKADDLTARRLAAADAEDRAAQGARELAAARGDLNALLGLPPATRLVIAASASTPAARAYDPAALFERARARRLDLAALRAGYESQEAAVRKAVWDAFPGLQLTLSRAQDTANNQTLGPAVNFTLPVWNRNQGGIAAARATRRRLADEYAARLVAARAQIAGLVEGLALEGSRRAVLAAQVGPLAEAGEAARAAERAGDLSAAQAQAVRQTAIERRLALIALDESIAEETLALELAVGGPLDPPAAPATAS